EERRLAEPDHLGDLAQADAGIAALGEQRLGGVEDLVPGALLACGGWLHHPTDRSGPLFRSVGEVSSRSGQIFPVAPAHVTCEEAPVSYCRIAPGHPVHGPYHDREYGFPLRDDAGLFERLVLEINQAGLSWLTILQKREHFVRAYDGFDLDRVAAYGARDRRRLVADPGIIRNRLKIEAAIENARRLVAIRD